MVDLMALFLGMRVSFPARTCDLVSVDQISLTGRVGVRACSRVRIFSSVLTCAVRSWYCKNVVVFATSPQVFCCLRISGFGGDASALQTFYRFGVVPEKQKKQETATSAGQSAAGVGVPSARTTDITMVKTRSLVLGLAKTSTHLGKDSFLNPTFLHWPASSKIFSRHRHHFSYWFIVLNCLASCLSPCHASTSLALNSSIKRRSLVHAAQSIRHKYSVPSTSAPSCL